MTDVTDMTDTTLLADDAAGLGGEARDDADANAFLEKYAGTRALRSAATKWEATIATYWQQRAQVAEQATKTGYGEAFISDKVREFDARARPTMDASVAEMEREIARADVLVSDLPPVFALGDPIHAQTVNGVASDAVHYTPEVFERVARRAMAMKDVALVQRLHDLGESQRAYRPAYKAAVGFGALLAEMSAMLVTPIMRRSNAAKAWQARARQDVATIRRLSGDPTSIGRYKALGALPVLFGPAE